MHTCTEREVADNLALLTDAYQLDMAAAYFAENMHADATFSFFVRRSPPDRGYLVAAGLEDVLRYLESLRFTTDALQHLKATGLYRNDFLDYLEQLRFHGDVWAMPEGGLCFATEPLIEVTAPIIEAQIIETYVINQTHLQTMLATKAARCVHAAAGRALVDFSLRRAHGTDAGMKSARASAIAGFVGTSNVLAARVYGLPALGTMAHSFVESFDREIDAFRAFGRLFPARTTLLVDTYDTLAGVRNAVIVAQEMAARGVQVNGVRLDSGDVETLSRDARRILDAAGLQTVKIFVSGGMDEHQVASLARAGAPIDAFGIGTELGVSGDAPWMDCAYKLVEYDGAPRLKLSAAKQTLVGRKQVWRAVDAAGTPIGDLLARRDEEAATVAAELEVPTNRVQARLSRVMAEGRILEPPPRLDVIRERFVAEFHQLPDAYKALKQPAEYPVRISRAMRHDQEAAIETVRRKLSAAAHEPRQ
jgi:nicotinate phosphoribosyltransferase